MRLYNSLTRSIDPLEPVGDTVSIYTCGITPYDTTHLGHAFTYAVTDILVRYLEFKGFQVQYGQNVTDIDDDILRRANEVNENWIELGNHWTSYYIEDMIALNIRPPDYFPRATDVIPQIIDSVKQLLEIGVAYRANGNVYYDIHSWPEFGLLCQLPYEQMLPIANERGNYPEDPLKKDPLDFVLWQAHCPGEPFWESPWGPGRPGWHIECSTMSHYFLGKRIDIHMGGADLLFPHHDCEIAQVAPLGDPDLEVRTWAHVAMVYHLGEKMSKSLGNLLMIRDLLQTHSANGIRLYLGCHHYRDSWSHDGNELRQMDLLAGKLSSALKIEGGLTESLDPDPAREAFIQFMDDDLSTHKVIPLLDNFSEMILSAAVDGMHVHAAQMALHEMAGVLGLRLGEDRPEKRVISGWQEHLTRFPMVSID